MTAEIWNTYELAIAATTGGLIVGVATVGLMVLKRLDGARELATAKGWWEKAIRVQEANDRARWAPAYSGNLFAIEADKPHEAEVLHVEHATGELPALSDRPAADEDEVGDEQPGEVRWFRLRFIAATLLFPFAWLAYKASPAVEYVADKWAEFQQTRRERDQVGTGQPTDDEPWTLWDEDELRAEGATEMELSMLRRGFVPIFDRGELNDRFPENLPDHCRCAPNRDEPHCSCPPELDIADEDELNEQRAEWVALNPPTLGPDGQRHWNDVTAMHGILTPGRHRKMPINASIPSQRDGEVQA